MSPDRYREKLRSAGWTEGDYPINQRLSIIAEILMAILEEATGNPIKRRGNGMTPEEFVCWLDGFKKALIGLPNEEGWKRLNEAHESACRKLGASRSERITRPGVR